MSEAAPAPQVRVVDAPLAAPSATQGLLEVFRRRYLLRLLVRREIQARYQGSVLGLFWSYLNPLSQFFLYWFIFGQVMLRGQNVETFAIHVFSGFIIVHFFTETFSSGTRSIVRNKSLVQKMAVPREMFPVSAMLVSLYHVVPPMIILLIASVAYGWLPDAGGMLAVVLALTLIMLLGTALALFFSTANVFFRDFGSAVNLMLHFVRFGVPMVYPLTMIFARLNDFWTEVYLANPLTIAVCLFQRAFWVGSTNDPAATDAMNMPSHLFERSLIMIAVAAVLLLIAQRVFTRLENKIPERL
ncbi:ABC transporter permease [Nocardioides insulae]|uniref:ABC transporter permease n=1 Tax=Nocardioides insulae TaxID=394734 RepID=UPI0004236A29|nr:ABC transporter permease [Nocardioides insulae]